MKRILKHLGLMAAVVVALILLALLILKWYTNHNDTLVVIPHIEGKLSGEAIQKLEDAGLRAEVVDTVYKDGARKLEVINQNPASGLKVKHGRRVYLVINSDAIPMVEIPDLVGRTSLSQAKNMLSRQGLRLGRVIERPSDFVKSRADEPVIGQYVHGDSVNLKAGSLIERNSIIDLVIGVPRNSSDSTSMAPAGEGDEGVVELF